MKIDRLDHLVLTVADISLTCEFYTRVLGMKVLVYEDNRTALCFGSQKINLHEMGREFEPKAHRPTTGSADLCFITRTSLTDVIELLQCNAVKIIEGPVLRMGAAGKMESVYFRDPDLNLIEISNYVKRFE